MITRAHITRRADADGIPAQTVERDYALAHVLGALARRGDQRLVFKGGTALRYCFLDECRYSADLDLSLVDINKPQALALVERILGREVAEMVEHRVATTKNRSVIGIMNEFAHLGGVYRASNDAHDLVALSLRLAGTPCTPLYGRYVSPDRELAAFVAQLSG